MLSIHITETYFALGNQGGDIFNKMKICTRIIVPNNS